MIDCGVNINFCFINFCFIISPFIYLLLAPSCRLTRSPSHLTLQIPSPRSLLSFNTFLLPSHPSNTFSSLPPVVLLVPPPISPFIYLLLAPSCRLTRSSSHLTLQIPSPRSLLSFYSFLLPSHPSSTFSSLPPVV